MGRFLSVPTGRGRQSCFCGRCFPFSFSLDWGDPMKLLRLVLAGLVVSLLAGVAYVSQQAEPPASKMADAAAKFLATLSAEQKEKAAFAFDSKERTKWYFTPQQAGKKATRKGLPLEEMKAGQKKLVLALLQAGTSATGARQATTIMALESILNALEKGKGPVRNPEWYFVSIFGTPSETNQWGWRIEGHHLSLNYTMAGGKVVSATPAFFGANPAIVKTGPKAGLETLPEAETLARELFLSLDAGQKKLAQRDKQFPEPKEATVFAQVGQPQGVRAEQLHKKQRELLVRLVESYAQRMPADIAQAELQRVQQGGIGKIHFAWSGGTQPGQPHSYRIQGPSFVIEFLNTQGDPAGNTANHIHSVWRRINGDFGLQKQS